MYAKNLFTEPEQQIEDMKCCGNCGARTFGTFDCGESNMICDKWKLRANNR